MCADPCSEEYTDVYSEETKQVERLHQKDKGHCSEDSKV